ncbi:MAG TPA: glycosyltransferase family 39 protein [Acidimicrobiales bacterium]|nr:glycosyltransferase family 39 protein [Acidimicrobiales bacterium]
MAAAPVVTRAPGQGAVASGAATDGVAASPPLSRAAIGAVAVASLAGIVLRTSTRSELWLDEALTVNLANVPLGHLTEALRRDGAPPLYYALLHGWISIFGTGNQAVRLLSAVFGVATLPVLYRCGRRVGGPIVGVGALVLLATSPFAVRYATEARMYSLVALLVGAGWLFVANALERPTIGWLGGVAGVGGLLLLTHYWSIYLLTCTGAVLVLAARRGSLDRRAVVRVLIAIGVGSVVLFGPWLPHFLYQRAHTGTPWGSAPGPVEVAFTTLVDIGGGPFAEGQALAGLLAALTLLALFGRAVDARRVELDVRTRPGVRGEAVIAATTLLVAVGLGTATSSAFASRYTSVAFPLIIVVAAYGLRALADRRIVAGVLVVASLLGLAGGVRNVVSRRTSADAVVAAILAGGGKPGDLVAYCPDQLGPDVTRVLPDTFDEATFPDMGDPHIVDWVDYATRMAAADPVAFGQRLLERSRGRTIWYVWMPGYRTLDKQCERINDTLGNARPGNRQLLEPDKSVFERHVLWMHPAATSS